MRFLKNFISVFLFLKIVSAFPQDDAGSSLLKKMEALPIEQYQEKIYVHTDQTTYLAGEIIWFKIYVTHFQTHQLSTLSKVAYLEILDSGNKAILQTKIEIVNGMGSGSLFIPATVNTSNYRLRCYTQWMKNFSEEFFFMQDITLINTFKKIQKEQPALPTYDIRFFPEGGHLVEGLKSLVAIRAVDNSGKGINFTGVILSLQRDTVASFHSTGFGMGSFEFTPGVNTEYLAMVKPAAGSWARIAFPRAEKEGVVLHLKDSLNNLTITLNRSAHDKEDLLLVIHTRGVVKYAKAIESLPANRISETIPFEKLGDGINTVTLFDGSMNPLCERLFFKRPNPAAFIQPQIIATTAASRKKVQLNLGLSGFESEAVNLSIAVTRQDSLPKFNSPTIEQYLLLLSDLKGEIESPEYYFTEAGTARDQALDLVMLCHGWSRFNWSEVLSGRSQPFEFLPEYRGHLVQGQVLDKEGRPAAGILTYLASPGKSVQVYPARSKSDGRILFEMKSFYGPRQLILQSDFEKDSLYSFNIQSPFSDKAPAMKLPALQLTPAYAPALLERSVSMQVNSLYLSPDSSSHKPVDSTAFYGVPDEHYHLDDYTRFPVMEEVLREYVKGVWVRKRQDSFHFIVPDRIHGKLMQDKPLVLLDGMPVFSINKLMEMDPRKLSDIEVMDKRYFLNGLVADGVASFKTYQGNLAGFPIDPRALVLDYEGLQLKKEFYSPEYDTPSQEESRLPDRRQVLLWVPQLEVKQNNTSLNFYTSDLKGSYRISIQGLSASGKPLSAILDFKVD